MNSMVLAAVLIAGAVTRTEDDLATFDRIEIARQANQQSILYWQGKATCESRSSAALAESLGPEAAIFSVDNVSRRVSIAVEHSAAQANDATDDSLRSELVVGELWLHPPMWKGSVTAGHWEIDLVSTVDPQVIEKSLMPVLRFELGDRPTAEVIASLRREVADQRTPVNLRQNGDVVEIRKSNALVASIFSEWSFDLAKSGSLIRYHDVSPLAETTCEYSYQRIEGIWLPESLQLEVRHDDENKSISRKIRFESQQVNEPLKDSAFTAEYIGVTSGDQITDRRTAQRYRSGRNGQSVAIGHKQAASFAANAPARQIDVMLVLRRLLLLAGAASILVSAVVRWTGRHRHGNRKE